jgi:hypothetical protein
MSTPSAEAQVFRESMSKTFCDDEDLRDTDLSEEVKSSSAAPLDATGVASFGESEEDDPAAASDPSSDPMMITAAARAPTWHTDDDECSREFFSLKPFSLESRRRKKTKCCTAAGLSRAATYALPQDLK